MRNLRTLHLRPLLERKGMSIAKRFDSIARRQSQMKVTVVLRNEHENVKSLFNRYKKPDTRRTNGKKELFDDIRKEIMVHSQIEREIFYSALTSTASTTAASLVAGAIEDHRAIEKLLQELNDLHPPDRSCETKMARMRDEVIRHIDKQEAEI